MSKTRVYSGVRKQRSGTTQPIKNVVYQTDNYKLFQYSKFNRNILLRDEMIEQAKEGFIAPIIVNENMVVIDGQHRLEASKRVGVPIEYIVKAGLGDKDIVRMNTVQKPWSLQNYIESFANKGLSEYIKLIELIKGKYSNVTVTSQIAMNSPTNATPVRKSIMSGNFEFYNYEKAVEFLRYYKRFCEETKTPKKSTVATALYELFKVKGFDKNRIIDKTIATELNEDIKVKTFQHTDILKSLIDSYNHQLRSTSPKYINYHITSIGNLIIDAEKEEWAIKNSVAGDNGSHES